MQVVPIYPVLIYQGMANNASIIQSDFKRVFDQLVADDKFQRREPHQHRISDTKFSGNMIAEFQLDTFEKEVLSQAEQYLKMIGWNTVNISLKITESWMTLTNQGEFAPKHEHGASDISGVFYVDTAGTDGQLYFASPTKQCQSSLLFAATQPIMSVPPTDNMFILFPGWLEHGISTQTTTGDRISVSFNIKATKNKGQK
jgi:uncharacterized protein (TIGR02466 family)